MTAAAILNKYSAVAEMGDRLATIDMGGKLGTGYGPFGWAGFPCDTMWPGPRPTFVPSGMLIQPPVWPQQTWAENWGGATRQNVKTRCLQEWVGQLEPKFQGEGVVPGEYFFGFYKTRHILLSESANCTVLRAVVLTQYRHVADRQTDGQTDRRNCCS